MMVCDGASHKVLHVWFELFTAYATKNTEFYESHAVMRTPSRTRQLHEIIRYMVESPFDLIGRLEYKAPATKVEMDAWHLIDSPIITLGASASQHLNRSSQLRASTTVQTTVEASAD
jgi:hypothetical protein